jgi:hypothetical protein
VFGLGGWFADKMLTYETSRWAKATGGAVHVVRPDRALGRMAREPRDLFDLRRAREVYPMAFDYTAQLLETHPTLASLAQPAPAKPVPAQPLPGRPVRPLAALPQPVPFQPASAH